MLTAGLEDTMETAMLAIGSLGIVALAWMLASLWMLMREPAGDEVRPAARSLPLLSPAIERRLQEFRDTLAEIDAGGGLRVLRLLEADEVLAFRERPPAW
jgi:hypothetical protein